MKLAEILQQTRAILEDQIIPIERHYAHLGWDKVVSDLAKVRETVKESGLWTPQIPKAFGGLGLSVADFGEMGAVLGESPFGHYCFNCQAPDAGNMEILIEYGTEQQKEQFLKPLLAGDVRSCFAMTEPAFAGSNPTMMGTVALRDGDYYQIDGHKWFTSSADGAAFAIVMAVTDPDGSNPYQKASQIIVPMDTPGLELVRNISVMGEAGAGWASHAELKYRACKVPLENILGSVGEGFAIAQKRLGPGRIHHCMRWMGICERAFDLMCKRASTREIGSGKRLSDQQTIQNWIAESRAEMNAAKLMVQDAARKIDSEGASNAREEISIIKFYCANVLQQVLDRSIQVHGALGITDDTPLAWWYRHERGARIYDGADEVHKTRVAKEILKKYKK